MKLEIIRRLNQKLEAANVSPHEYRRLCTANILKRTSKTDFWEMTLDHSVSFETKVVQFLESIWVPVTPSINLTGLYIKCRSRSPSGFALTREVKAVL